ncbi:methyltransferase domain-containing protein [Geobacter hydrogenophilus]|uniref:SAM-dependent methyltransferase n=1 Tax=Geobacter hydrogenophilus TaxID=40983 RepID=A0A9W6G265_9BACT|nr:methyltransferase [Geobacter hydrogenophilus]MBT0893059.1 methyltransferase domain-containing protein [Geobacter hydrogenophilus]GLI39101.1 SAM-dependent methyltransferase [Geobacter hydrogenophilus]
MEEKTWTPAELLQLSGGYWNACALHAAVALDVATPLAGEALTAAEVAERLAVDVRGVAMLLDALAAMALVHKREDRYEAAPFAARYLAKSSPEYLGYIIMHHHHLMAGWSRLDEAVRRGAPVRESASHGDDEGARESFLMGMFNLAMQSAPKVVPLIDLTGRKRLLDLGGGPGTWAINFCLQNPRLDAIVYDLPTTRRFAEETVARFGLADRVGFVAGDFLENDTPKGFDVVWLSQILHAYGPDQCAVILEKAVGALEPGGLLLVQEFILDDTRSGPLFPALFSLNMLVGTTAGQSYSEHELYSMMAAAGLRDVRRLPLELPNGSGILAGTVRQR